MSEIGQIQRGTLIRKLLRISAIGVGVIAGPGVLFVLPYLLPLEEFSSFAAVLAIAQLIGNLGALSLDVSCPRLGIKFHWAAVYCLVSVLLASAVVHFGLGGNLNEKFIVGGLIAWVSTLTAILLSYPLFAAKAKLYGVVGLLKALAFLFILILSLRLGVIPAMAWLIAAMCSLFVVAVILKFKGGQDLIRRNSQSGWKDVVRFSAPLAVIVTTSALPFVLDRAIGQQLLSTTEFARYAVAVTWAVPIIYIGNIIQQSIIASTRYDTLRTTLYWAGWLFVMSLLYISLVAILSLYFVRVPYFVDGLDFIHLWGWIVGWYAIYSAINFPLAAVMQKHFSAFQFKTLAYVNAGVIGSWLIFSYSLYTNFDSLGWTVNKTITLILFTAIFAALGMSAKAVFVYRHLAK